MRHRVGERHFSIWDGVRGSCHANAPLERPGPGLRDRGMCPAPCLLSPSPAERSWAASCREKFGFIKRCVKAVHCVLEPSIYRRLLAHSELRYAFNCFRCSTSVNCPWSKSSCCALSRRRSWGDLVKVRLYIGTSFHSGASPCAPQSLGEASPSWDSVILEERGSVIWGDFGNSVQFSETRTGCFHETCPSSSRHTFLELGGCQDRKAQHCCYLFHVYAACGYQLGVHHAGSARKLD